MNYLSEAELTKLDREIVEEFYGQEYSNALNKSRWHFRQVTDKLRGYHHENKILSEIIDHQNDSKDQFLVAVEALCGKIREGSLEDSDVDQIESLIHRLRNPGNGRESEDRGRTGQSN